jgi:hypothetical protein
MLMTFMFVSAAGWHLEQVVVVDECSGKRWTFSCDRWDLMQCVPHTQLLYQPWIWAAQSACI